MHNEVSNAPWHHHLSPRSPILLPRERDDEEGSAAPLGVDGNQGWPLKQSLLQEEGVGRSYAGVAARASGSVRVLGARARPRPVQ